MANAPTPVGGRQFSGKGVVVALGIISLVVCAIVIALVRKDVNSAMDEQSDIEVADALVQPVGDDEPGWWRCALHIDVSDKTAIELHRYPATTIPFFLWIPSDNDPRSAYIRSASEWIEVSAVFDGQLNHLDIKFHHYDSDSRIIANGGHFSEALSGEWIKVGPSGDSTMAFTAQQAGDAGFCSACLFARGHDHESHTVAPVPEFSYAGSWAMDFDQSGNAVGVFTGSRELACTIMTSTGEYRYLNGYENSDLIGSAQISFFDGDNAFLFVLFSETVSVDGEMITGSSESSQILSAKRSQTSPDENLGLVESLVGHFYSGNTWHESFTATRLLPGEDFDIHAQPAIDTPFD